MPNPEQRLDQLEPVISEMLAKQDQLSAKQDQLSAQVRQQNASVLNQLNDQGHQLVALKNRLDGLEDTVEQGFTLINQRLTDLFTLLGEKFK
jgi:chromosome segregation ATPase